MSITFDAAHSAAHRRGNRRKAVQSIGFLARRHELDSVPETIFQANGELVDLADAGFEYAGLVSTDGYNFERSDSVEGDGSHGFADNTREDLESTERTISVTFQESKRVVHEICDGADYRNLEVGTHELVKHKPAMPMNDEWCLVTVYRDGAPGNEHLQAKIHPTIKAQSVGGEQWSNTAIGREVNFKVYTDDELGTPEIECSGGAAFLSSAENQGYKIGAPSGGGD